MKSEIIKHIEQLNQLKEPFIRDLIWLVYLDNLSAKALKEKQFTFTENANMEALLSWYKKLQNFKFPDVSAHLPLGKYAELLIEFYLKYHRDYELLNFNLQLIENKITVGELDFLFKDLKTESYVHLEFSIKFYLKVQRQGQVVFLGPNAKDFLARKIKKLLEHQTKLCVDFKHLLPKDVQDINFQAKILMKGCLFYPWAEWCLFSKDKAITQAWWLDISEVELFKSDTDKFSLITAKRNWIFPYNNSFEKYTFDVFKQTAEQMLSNRNEVMVVRYGKGDKPMDHGFLMRKNWPN